MEDISVSTSTGENSGKTPGTHFNTKKISHRKFGFDHSIIALIAEIGVNFFRYLKILGMSGETNLIVACSLFKANPEIGLVSKKYWPGSSLTCSLN